ncbi:GNAT family N-acetyltransferase [Marivirga sp. S37H4]|uniref:GNAT family N-acetyltransferase n=1 Tax=Marivirga aurantiaca TaxID=2802615 RepID=A0A934X0D1_9BACT|nr:GNAT family N-acetyltransferase [Marivirga aurantiaca]MBK6266152.1 GNAT family N-acetyltransferase [Marivirga aurantiaca]
MKYILETKRLRLRELTLDDVPFIVALLNSPGWLQFIGDRNVRNPEQAKQYLENGPLKSYKENNYGIWLVETKEEKNAIGTCGIIRREHLDHPDIGFAFLPEQMAKGYAYEMAHATLNYAKDKLKIFPILAIVVAENHKSISLLERIGLQFIKTFYLPGDKKELLLFSTKGS